MELLVGSGGPGTQMPVISAAMGSSARLLASSWLASASASSASSPGHTLSRWKWRPARQLPDRDNSRAPPQRRERNAANRQSQAGCVASPPIQLPGRRGARRPAPVPSGHRAREDRAGRCRVNGERRLRRQRRQPITGAARVYQSSADRSAGSLDLVAILGLNTRGRLSAHRSAIGS